jgi:hypothetical protein
MNEFTSAPFDDISSVVISDIDHNNSVTVTFSTDPFGPIFPETIVVSGIHPTLSLDLKYDVDRHHWQLVKMDPDTPSHRLSHWKSCLRYAYILYIDTMSIHTVADMCLAVAEARSSNRKSIIVALTKYESPNCLSAVRFPQLYFDQL